MFREVKFLFIPLTLTVKNFEVIVLINRKQTLMTAEIQSKFASVKKSANYSRETKGLFRKILQKVESRRGSLTFLMFIPFRCLMNY